MGLAEGIPTSIRPDPVGRASYLGHVVSLASEIARKGTLQAAIVDLD